MKRKDFLYKSGAGLGAFTLGGGQLFAKSIPTDTPWTTVDAADKKKMADIALNAARSKGATYADVRIGRYLNQFIVTREAMLENIVNTESYGMGIRVIANGAWGFSATDRLTTDGIARAAELAVSIAKENSRLLTEPVQLAPQKGVGEISWKTPVVRNTFEVPLKEKAELLLHANAKAMSAGASFINTSLFQVNEQKYFASTDGSYIDQDIHRLWPTFTLTKTDSKTGLFATRNALSAPVGMGYEYLMPADNEKIKGIVTRYKKRYDLAEDCEQAAAQAAEKLVAKPVEPGKYDLVLDPTNLFLTIHESVGIQRNWTVY